MDARINLKLSDELKKRAEKKAQELGLSLSAYIRLTLVQSLEKKQ